MVMPKENKQVLDYRVKNIVTKSWMEAQCEAMEIVM